MARSLELFPQPEKDQPSEEDKLYDAAQELIRGKAANRDEELLATQIKEVMARRNWTKEDKKQVIIDFMRINLSENEKIAKAKAEAKESLDRTMRGEK